PISNGVKEEKGDGPADEKPDQGGKALSYKGAVESKALETNSSGDVRRNSQHVSGKQDVKGKGIVYEGGKQVTSGKFGPVRSKEQGRPTAKYIRNACYLPPQELRDSYAMATSGLNGLRNQDFGAHLDPQQKLMLEAFKSGESGEASGSKTCKALLFDNEIGEEGPRELLGDDQAATEVAATVENKDLKEENGMVLSTVENGGKQTLEIESKEDEVIGEMVAGLDEEDGLFELEMMEDGEEDGLFEAGDKGPLPTKKALVFGVYWYVSGSSCGGVVYAALVVYAVVGTGTLWNVVVIYAMVAALWSVMIGSGAGYIAIMGNGFRP
ncbi:unnamed protein product, partial [Brassica oleracea]